MSASRPPNLLHCLSHSRSRLYFRTSSLATNLTFRPKTGGLLRELYMDDPLVWKHLPIVQLDVTYATLPTRLESTGLPLDF